MKLNLLRIEDWERKGKTKRQGHELNNATVMLAAHQSGMVELSAHQNVDTQIKVMNLDLKSEDVPGGRKGFARAVGDAMGKHGLCLEFYMKDGVKVFPINEKNVGICERYLKTGEREGPANEKRDAARRSRSEDAAVDDLFSKLALDTPTPTPSQAPTPTADTGEEGMSPYLVQKKGQSTSLTRIFSETDDELFDRFCQQLRTAVPEWDEYAKRIPKDWTIASAQSLVRRMFKRDMILHVSRQCLHMRRPVRMLHRTADFATYGKQYVKALLKLRNIQVSGPHADDVTRACQSIVDEYIGKAQDEIASWMRHSR